jgi:glycosyltransferase involved in cell wall biosynthesis
VKPRHRESDQPVVLDVRVVTGSGGGPDKTILNSPRYLRAAGYRMLCAYLHPPGDPGFAQLRHKAERWQAPLLSIPDRGPWDWNVYRQLLRVCRQQRVAIWHGHDYKSNLLGLLLRPLWPMRLVTTVHGWVEHTARTPLYYAVDRFCLPRYEQVLCVSEDLHRRCLGLGVKPRRCRLLENGIDTAEFTRRRSVADAKRDLGWPAERLLIGAVGRLSAEKGFDLLIRATAELLRTGLDAGLVIAGAGGQQAELQRLSSELGCDDRVRLLGYRQDPRDLYEALDLFALSSLREGLPNVVLEALAMQVPVVATRVAGVPRLIRDGENGLLVEPGSVEQLTAGLRRGLGDPGLRQRLSTAGRRTVEEGYSFAVRLEKVALLYDRLLRRRHRHQPAEDHEDHPHLRTARTDAAPAPPGGVSDPPRPGGAEPAPGLAAHPGARAEAHAVLPGGRRGRADARLPAAGLRA